MLDRWLRQRENPGLFLMVDDPQPTLIVLSLERTQENCRKRSGSQQAAGRSLSAARLPEPVNVTKMYYRLPFNLAGYVRSIPLDGDAAVKTGRDEWREPRGHSWHGKFQTLNNERHGVAVLDRESAGDLCSLLHCPKVICGFREGRLW